MPARDPNHRVAIEASPKRVRVMFNGKTVVDTLNAALVLETGHMPVYYFPRANVRTDLLQRSDHITHCPYKGEASYGSLRVKEKFSEDALWSYSDPLPECPRIKGHYCFYPEKVDGMEVEGQVAP